MKRIIFFVLVAILIASCEKETPNFESKSFNIGAWNMSKDGTIIIDWQLKSGYQISKMMVLVIDDADFGYKALPQENISYFSGGIYLTRPEDWNLRLYSDTTHTRGTATVEIIRF